MISLITPLSIVLNNNNTASERAVASLLLILIIHSGLHLQFWDSIFCIFYTFNLGKYYFYTTEYILVIQHSSFNIYAEMENINTFVI